MEDARWERVMVVPCSGIGKTYGTVTRDAAYVLAEDLRPAQVELLPLSLVVLGDEALKVRLQGCPAITIDGCNLECSRKNVSEAGAVAIETFQVLDAYRRHRHLKPQGIQQLNAGGLALAQCIVGFLLGGVLLVKAAFSGILLTAGSLLQLALGFRVGPDFAMYIFLLVAGLAGVILYMRHIRSV